MIEYLEKNIFYLFFFFFTKKFTFHAAFILLQQVIETTVIDGEWKNGGGRYREEDNYEACSSLYVTSIHFS